MKVSIMAQSERGRVIVGSTSLAPPEGSTTAIRSTEVSSTANIALEAEAVVEASPCDLFDVPVHGLTLFICAYRCLRKVAPMGAVI